MELNVTDCVPDQEGEDAFRVVTDTNSSFGFGLEFEAFGVWFRAQGLRFRV